METTARRATERRREFAGEPRGSQLAHWLNGEAAPHDLWIKQKRPGRPAIQRVEAIIEQLKKSYSPAGVIQLQENYKLWKMTARYRFKLMFGGKTDTGMPNVAAIRDRAGEALSVWRLFLLQQDDLQWRLRRCDWCKRWLFAHFSSQRFCSGTDCRKKHRENSEEYKEYKRRKQREYYHHPATGKRRR